MPEKWKILVNRSGEVSTWWTTAKMQEDALRNVRRRVMKLYGISYAKVKDLDYEITLIK
jgi:hypothetical protein